MLKYIQDVRFHYEIYSTLATLTRKCDSFAYPLYHFFTKIKIKKVPWQNMSNFLGKVLKKFTVRKEK